MIIRKLKAAGSLSACTLYPGLHSGFEPAATSQLSLTSEIGLFNNPRVSTGVSGVD